MKKYKKYIHKGIIQALSNIPYHNLSKAPVKRMVMLNNIFVPKSNNYISVNFIKKLPKNITKYCKLHKHNFDEINLIISQNRKLTYKIQLGEEIYTISSNSSVFIPKGLIHKAEVSRGEGIFVSILLNGDYKAFE